METHPRRARQAAPLQRVRREELPVAVFAALSDPLLAPGAMRACCGSHGPALASSFPIRPTRPLGRAGRPEESVASGAGAWREECIAPCRAGPVATGHGIGEGHGTLTLATAIAQPAVPMPPSRVILCRTRSLYYVALPSGKPTTGAQSDTITMSCDRVLWVMPTPVSTLADAMGFSPSAVLCAGQ